MVQNEIALASRQLAEDIKGEQDPRNRMRLCRKALGVGKTAVAEADHLADDEISDIQAMLRLAHRTSKGIYNPNTSITKLAKKRMERLGLVKLPVIRATRPKLVGTETACLSIADRELPENWWDTGSALEAINSGRYMLAGVGADGVCSLCIRLVAAREPFLDPPEYKKVIEALPNFSLRIESGQIWFGSAENVAGGVGFPLENGQYLGSVVSLRSGRNLRHVATIVRSESRTDVFHQLPEFREL